MKEAIKLAWIGALGEDLGTASPVAASLQSRRGLLQSADVRDLLRCRQRRRLHAERSGAMARSAIQSPDQWSDFPKRLDLFRWRWRLNRDVLAPCRQQSLKVGETANVSARPDIVKRRQPTRSPAAHRRARKISEIQRRTWLDRGTLPVRQIVQCDPFGDGSAPNASFGGDVPEGPPGRMDPFGVDEQGLTG
jgi:hypothetical protein